MQYASHSTSLKVNFAFPTNVGQRQTNGHEEEEEEGWQQDPHTSLTSSRDSSGSIPGGRGKGTGAGEKYWWSLVRSTARSTPHCGQLKRDRPCGTLSMALHRAQGSWIFVGSMPCAWGAPRRPPPTAISSGGSICGSWHLGQLNSVIPGATVRIQWHPAHRTWQLPGGMGGACGTEGCTITTPLSLPLSLSTRRQQRREKASPNQLSFPLRSGGASKEGGNLHNGGSHGGYTWPIIIGLIHSIFPIKKILQKFPSCPKLMSAMS